MQMCSKEAYAACPARDLCGPIEEATFTEGSACEIFNSGIDGTLDLLPEPPNMLRTGDPCPLCRQPLRTSDSAMLRILTLIRNELDAALME